MSKARWWYVLLLLGSPLLTGCSIFAPFYFAAIMMGYDTRMPPQFEFPEDAKRIVVITYTDLETQMEMGRLDREINELVSRRLFEGFGDDEDKPEIILARKVAEWQDRHPDWEDYDPAEIGRQLKADYVIYLELSELSLFEDGASKSLYHGQVEVAISVIRCEDGELAFAKDVLAIEIPRGRPIPASEMPFRKFRRYFVSEIARRISWYFLPHDRTEEYDRDPF